MTRHSPEFMVVSGSLDIRKPKGTAVRAVQDLFRGRHAYDWVERAMQVRQTRKRGEHGRGGCNPYRTERAIQIR